MLKLQAVSQIATEASRQAYVLAYNDAFYLTFLIASVAAAGLCLHMLQAILAKRAEARHAATTNG